jgi:hypothetical protein
MSLDKEHKSQWDILYSYNIKPYEKCWRELMLDLGVPLDVEWELWVWVSWGKDRDDLPFDVNEMVSVQDLSRWRSGEAIGETEVSKSDLELFSPVYVMRTRIFLFNDTPSRETVPPLSPMFPDGPFFELKKNRIAPNARGTFSFRFDEVPRDRWQEEFLRHTQWWEGTFSRGGLPSGTDQPHEQMNMITRRQGRGGDRRAKWKKELWSKDNLKRYVRLVRELAPKWTWIKSNDYDPQFSTPQEWVDDLRSRTEFSALFADCKKLTDDLLLRVTDTSLSSTEREPVALACVHAAHELRIIEIYAENGELPPSTRTLRGYYENGVELIP